MSDAISLRLGRWQDALADVETCDALICDPPYSARTHEGQRNDDVTKAAKVPTIEYAALTPEIADEIAQSWAPRTKNWAFLFCDHRAFQWHEAAWERAGWLVFAPLMVKLNPTPRFSGDGPAIGIEFICVARRRQTTRCGSLPAWYEVMQGQSKGGVAGAKDVGVMRAIVRDYSRPGDLVVDPFCGSGTTAEACAIEGRRCITSELDPKTYAIAEKRLARGHTPDFFSRSAS